MKKQIPTPTIEMNPTTTNDPAPAYEAERILLAIDVHLNKYVVRRQLDGLEPQPSQTFKSEHTFIRWAEKQTRLAKEVYSVYEAGPLGFGLHYKLTKLGIHNVVIKAKVLDEDGTRRKNDSFDTSGLIRDLDRYLRGNKRALRTVRIPTEAEQLTRTETRARQALLKTRKRLESTGRGFLLFYSHTFKGAWWKELVWTEQVVPAIPEALRQALEGLRAAILEVEKQLLKATQKITQGAAPGLPKGLGSLSSEVLDREIVDWGRFKNSKALSSYTGLCPGENSSGTRERKLSITKQGNPTVRHTAVEMAWRLVRFQPGYRAVRRFFNKIRHNGSVATRKRAIVALARQFMVDWWKIRTGRAKAEDLGLILNPIAA